MTRRDHLAAMLAMAAFLLPSREVAIEKVMRMEEIIPQFGLIGQIIAQPGQRSELAAILTGMDQQMPGNFGYLVGEDSSNADALWVVEIWEDEAAHRASLALPAVQAAIARGRPLIAGFGERFTFRPVPRSHER